ncbi:MAG: hypothetical protein JW915_07310 [Chitinispirillaceae bacterium]|nr:hypothetical protein [Chitinispirillaceae bacterium]
MPQKENQTIQSAPSTSATVSTVAENNKRIAKNTLLLYIRMLLTMIVSLYTVRVVLHTLGIVDYGLYNVVGGVVTMFSFFSNTMAVASQRFFTFELGRNDLVQLKKIFSMTMTIYIMLAAIVLLLAETVGLWFVNTQMTIPADRMDAVRWVYQFSIFSFIMTMLTVPYNGAMIAHEKMNVYAYVSIIEVTLKLIIVYLLVMFSFDKLKTYAVLIFTLTTIVTFIYRTYSKCSFQECRYIFYWDTPQFKQLLSYSGWNLLGAVAGVLNGQGINIILNIFFGPAVNTARGIAYHVNSTINQFVQNFMKATNPQIIKYYAANEKERMMKLVFLSSKLSFLLLFVLSMPVLLETKFIFALWLKEVPEYVVLFTRLIIIAALIDTLSYSLMTAAQATGDIKKYTIVVGSLMLLNLPISYLFLKLGFNPAIVFYISIIITFACLIARTVILKQMISAFDIKYFYIKIIPRLLLVVLVSSVLSYVLRLIFSEGIIKPLLTIIVGILITSIAIYTFGLNHEERRMVFKLFNRKKVIK